MPKVRIIHPDLGPQKTYLTAEVAAAATSSTVENNDDFASGDVVLFGKFGQEKAESVVLTGVTGNTQIDHGTGPVFPHPVRTPIFQLYYDQAEIYSAASEGGTYSLLTTITLNFDEPETIYNDTAGDTSTYYKYRFKNSQSAVVSDYSSEAPGTGFGDDTLASMSDEILEAFGDVDAKQVTRDQVRKYLNSGVRRLVMQIIRMYPDYFGAYTTQALSTTNSYSYPTNFITFKRIDIGTSTTDAYNAEFKKEHELDPTLTYTEQAPRVVMRDATWKTYPVCNGKTAYIYYWQYPSAMTDDDDEHGLPYGGRDVIITYALYRLWLDKDVERSTTIKSLFNDQVKEYLDFVGQSRQASNNWYQDTSFGQEDYFYSRYQT